MTRLFEMWSKQTGFSLFLSYPASMDRTSRLMPFT